MTDSGDIAKTVDVEAELRNTTLYQEFLAERDEILRHKWIESEKAGYDIGFERALADWIINHRAAWRRWRRELRNSLTGGGNPVAQN